MKIFITNLPAFYKINLYNRIAKEIPIIVVFTGDDFATRNDDFVKGEMKFPNIFLKGNALNKSLQFRNLLKQANYSELVFGAWDNLPSWFGVFTSPKGKNSFAIESSVLESKTKGIKGVLKRLFVNRMSRTYCSGKSQAALARAIGFRGDIVITKGVGIFNYGEQPPFESRKTVKNFIYVGRLVKEKNLPFLVKRFNEHPELHLDIVGFGYQDEELKGMAKENISFRGAVDNAKLPQLYRQSDVFILPSVSEPWGLVVEEALNNGLPVMVSNKVGCADEIVNESNGVVFDLDEDDFEAKLKQMTDIKSYNNKRQYISGLNFEEIEKHQVEVYLK